MATKPKVRKKKTSTKRPHANNLLTTGLFRRRDETAIALGKLEAMSDTERRTLMEALHHQYGKSYFRINVLHGTFEKVGEFIDLYMLMKLYWDIQITIYSLPSGTAEDGMTLDELDHYELRYKHRVPSTMSAIRELPVMIATNFIDEGTEPFMIRIDLIPVLPIDKEGEEVIEPFEPSDVEKVHYWYDENDPHNCEFKHRQRTNQPKAKGWNYEKFKEYQNAILRTYLSR